MLEITDLLKQERARLLKAFALGLIENSREYYRSKGKSGTSFKNSDLIKGLRLVANDEGLTILAKDYIEYLELGS